MIRNPNDIQEGAKKIRMLIAGYPGIGKSTLALSAPNPLHIDVDFGIDRIEPRYLLLCGLICAVLGVRNGVAEGEAQRQDDQ